MALVLALVVAPKAADLADMAMAVLAAGVCVAARTPFQPDSPTRTQNTVQRPGVETSSGRRAEKRVKTIVSRLSDKKVGSQFRMHSPLLGV